jgi:hypothetical protein
MSNPAIVDLFDDTNQQVLHKLSKLVAMPDFVKQATVQSNKQEVLKTPQVFADAINHKFPCHTKAATWLSQLYFLESRHLYPTKQADQIQAKIDKQAAWWGIGGQTKQAKQAWESHQVPAEAQLTDDDYALVIEHDGKPLRRWPVTNALNAKAAAETLYRFRSRFPYEWRKSAAARICTKMAQLGVTDVDPVVYEYIIKAAGKGSAVPAMVGEALWRRALMMPNTPTARQDKVAATKIAKAMIEDVKTIQTPNMMTKLAGIIDQIDRKYGFYPYYDEAGLSMPEEICFQLTEKKAQLFRDGHFSLQTGTIIPIEALMPLNLGKVASAMGNDFEKAVVDGLDVDVEKFARIASTLPRPDAQLLERSLAAAGLKFEVLKLEDAVK